MNSELQEIEVFLSNHHPFNRLPKKALQELTENIDIRYFRAGTPIPREGTIHDYLYIIRSGAVEIFGNDKELLIRSGEGDTFGSGVAQLANQKGIYCKAIEDSLIYQIAAEAVDTLCENHRQLAYFFGAMGGARLRQAISTVDKKITNPQINIMTAPIGDLINRLPVSVSPTTTVSETAEVMSLKGVSSILITENEKLIGIVTDRDLRNRVLARGLDGTISVSEIMTPNPNTLQTSNFTFEAILQMARWNIHHIPVLDGDIIKGMITATDITQRRMTSAVFLVNSVYKQKTITALKEISAQIPHILYNLVKADASANSIGHLITTVVDAITVRLIQLAEEKLGKSPVPFAWVAAGSQGRSEQTAKSDQDNCLIISDDYNPTIHKKYFIALTTFVCDGLNECGYVYCPGEMMATNPQWMLTQSQWKKKFTKWIDQPEPKALMLLSVFFDIRFIYGNEQLFKVLHEFVVERTQGKQIFLAYMAGNALQHKPPLGFFRNFVLIHDGEHDNTFDMKHSGTVPIIDLARVHALSIGSTMVNTFDRLAQLSDSSEISQEGLRDLQDALEFLSILRLKHQANLIAEGKRPDNFLSPDTLSHFERNHLKDAFSIIHTIQRSLQQRYLR